MTRFRILRPGPPLRTIPILITPIVIIRPEFVPNFKSLPCPRWAVEGVVFNCRGRHLINLARLAHALCQCSHNIRKRGNFAHYLHFDSLEERRKSLETGHTLPVYLPLKEEPNEHRIWGLTALILHQTLKSMLPRELYTFEGQPWPIG